MKKIALLTIENLDGFVEDESMAEEPLRKLGIKVDWVPWRQAHVNWKQYELAVIRTTWDYQKYPEEFFAVLEEIEEAGVRLANSSRIVRWNMDKSYLPELAGKGIGVVPTRNYSSPTTDDLIQAFSLFNCGELVIKPTVSATAFDTFRFRKDAGASFFREMQELFANRNCLLQPFMENITKEGEYSLVYFDGNFSHAFLKVAKEGDYRVQEEHGGEPHPIQPEEELFRAAEAVLACIAEPLLYARVDLVRWENAFLLMEVELIEPALYFRMDAEGAPDRFAKAVERWIS